jgi:membrane-bound acyltransferase YfiQ involved in biofilm formation
LERKTVKRFAGFYHLFNESIVSEFQALPANLNRYHQAAIGFVILNAVYLVLAYWKVPSFNITAQTMVSLVFFVLFVGLLAKFIYGGSRKLVLVLAAVYAGRILFSSYTVVAGIAHPMVPYVLPTTLLSFYLFGRTLWDWP